MNIKCTNSIPVALFRPDLSTGPWTIYLKTLKMNRMRFTLFQVILFSGDPSKEVGDDFSASVPGDYLLIYLPTLEQCDACSRAKSSTCGSKNSSPHYPSYLHQKDSWLMNLHSPPFFTHIHCMHQIYLSWHIECVRETQK